MDLAVGELLGCDLKVDSSVPLKLFKENIPLLLLSRNADWSGLHFLQSTILFLGGFPTRSNSKDVLQITPSKVSLSFIYIYFSYFTDVPMDTHVWHAFLPPNLYFWFHTLTLLLAQSWWLVISNPHLVDCSTEKQLLLRKCSSASC